MEKDFSKYYQSSLFDIFKNQDTRRLGRNLVISSIITILLSKCIIDISSGSILGIKISVNQEGNLVLLSMLISLYFFINFILSTYRDIVEYRHNIKPIKDISDNFNNAIENDVKLKKQQAQEHIKLYSENSKKINNIIEKRKKLYKDAETMNLEDREIYLDKLYDNDDGLEQLQDNQESILELIQKFDIEYEIAAKRNLKYINKQSNMYITLGTISEIVIPILVFIYALLSSINMLYQG